MNECLLSFDIEDWFQAHNLQEAIPRSSWDRYELHVEKNTDKILKILDRYDTKATFFILGWIAEKVPDMVKKIDAEGHEIACHGYDHSLLSEMDIEKIKKDIQRSKGILSQLTTQPIKGYRAPSFTINDDVTKILKKLSFEYDSSFYKIAAHDRYGRLSNHSNETIYDLSNGLTEAQMPTLKIFKSEIPWAGGGYFRFIPYPIFKLGIEKILKEQDFIFYLHPWELDTNQPKHFDIRMGYRIRHYTNLKRTEDKLEKLIRDFDWKPIGDMI